MLMNIAGLKVRAHREAFSDNVVFQIVQRVDGSTPFVAVAQPLEFRPIEQGMLCPPCLSLQFDQAQFLMDQLWDCGLRPSEGTGSAGQLAATQRHLEDMRTLVFKPNA